MSSISWVATVPLRDLYGVQSAQLTELAEQAAEPLAFR